MSVSYRVWLRFCQPGLKDTVSQGLQVIRYWTSFLPPSDTGGIHASVMELWVISWATKFLGFEGGSEKLNKIQSTHFILKLIWGNQYALCTSNWVHWKKCLKFVDSYEGYEVQWSCNKYWGQKMYFIDMKTQWSNQEAWISFLLGYLP